MSPEPADFSYAGADCGERPLPELPLAADVRAFGAVGDGRADDTAAFQRALAATPAGAVRVPEGRYRIRGILSLDKPGLALRGDGPGRSTLAFDRPLTDVKPDWGATTDGVRTSNYSWSGGYVRIDGDLGLQPLAGITADAEAGQRSVAVAAADAAGLAVGQWVGLQVEDDAPRTLTQALYGGDPGPIEALPPLSVWQPARILALEGGRVSLDRPLRLPLRAAWRPRLLALRPRVTGSGIEGLAFDFPPTPWGGEFSELGYNAIALAGAAHCWVRDVALHNAEGGIFVQGMHCSVQGARFTSDKPAFRGDLYGTPLGCAGHHGIELAGPDHHVSGFDFGAAYVHDLTVDGPSSAGNVFSGGRGADLCLDHHRRANHHNLFCDLDFGLGSRPWRSGGGRGLGRHCGVGSLFWGLRAAQPLAPPPAGWGPPGLQLAFDGRPADLHAQQRVRRLGARP